MCSNSKALIGMPAGALVLLVVLGLVSCGGSATPEQRVRAWLEAGEAAAEKRELRVLREMISVGYKDEAGRDRRGVVRLLAGYFYRNRAVHILTRIEQIDLPAEGRAQVVLYAAMAGTPIEGVQGLTSIRADLHRFELHLTEEEGEWKLSKAAWRRASAKDFVLPGDS